jgi:hypothetical protein
MNTDRDLLEAAARAAGLWPAPEPFERLLERWNPLLDDADTCQLIAAIPLSLRFDENDHTIHVVHRGKLVWEAVYAGDADRTAIARRAVVNAAAILEARSRRQ